MPTHFARTAAVGTAVLLTALCPAPTTDATAQTEPAVTLVGQPQPLNIGQDGHAGFPGLTRLPDGDLHLTWRQGSDHVASRDGVIMRAVSYDDGATWTEPITLRSGPDYRDPSMATIDGTTWLTWFTGTHSTPARGAQVMAGFGPVWRVDPQLPYAAITAPLVELPDGRLGAAFYGRKSGEAVDTAWMGWSNDGKAWTTNRIANSIGAGVHHNEPYLAVNPVTGTTHFFYRHGTAGGIGLRSTPDSGATWGPTRKILSNASGRPTVLATASGTLVMVYRYLPGKHGLMAYSTDDGVTWLNGGTVMVAPAGSPNGMTYATMSETSPGTVRVVLGMEQADGSSQLYGAELAVP